LKIDGISVLKYSLCDQTFFDRSKVLIHGTSLGAGVGLHTLMNSPLTQRIKGFIIENTFTSLGDMADHIYPKLKIFRKLILRNFWDNDQYVKQLPKHLSGLFITGKKDEITPTYMLKSIFKDCTLQNKMLMELENGMHNNTWFVHREEYFETVDKFIKGLFN
jgi:fermentation-respiration switch protein FrsA (DUF1100 family)